jgi:hypothetical protein
MAGISLHQRDGKVYVCDSARHNPNCGAFGWVTIHIANDDVTIHFSDLESIRSLSRQLADAADDMDEKSPQNTAEVPDSLESLAVQLKRGEELCPPKPA